MNWNTLALAALLYSGQATVLGPVIFRTCQRR